MSDSSGFLLAVAATWLVIGVALSVLMGRRGHDSFGWLVTGALLGPLAFVLAVDARRHEERMQPERIPVSAPAPPLPAGPVDVVVGYDGSPESVAALDAVAGLLGERLGRLTVVTVVPYGDIRLPQRQAADALRSLAARGAPRPPELEVLHGHPATALAQLAAEGGYDLIAVGTRGSGITKAVLGSASSQLARDSKVPVLLVGGQRAA